MSIFRGDLTPHRLLLLGHEDDAKPAFADLLEQLVRTNHDSRQFGDWFIHGGDKLSGGLIHERTGVLVGLEELFHLLTQGRVTRAGALEVGRPFHRVVNFQRFQKDRTLAHRPNLCGRNPSIAAFLISAIQLDITPDSFTKMGCPEESRVASQIQNKRLFAIASDTRHDLVSSQFSDGPTQPGPSKCPETVGGVRRDI